MADLDRAEAEGMGEGSGRREGKQQASEADEFHAASMSAARRTVDRRRRDRLPPACDYAVSGEGAGPSANQVAASIRLMPRKSLARAASPDTRTPTSTAMTGETKAYMPALAVPQSRTRRR